jgi:aryl-alcohol dehydrogenase-like predicted oxidoreductase
MAVWAPLAGGFLSGKYAPGERSVEGTRSAENWIFPSTYFAANADESLTVLLNIAKELDRSPAQVALRWVLDQPAVTSAIVGARIVDHLRDNFKAYGWKLPDGARKRLNEVSHLPDRYPESMEKNMRQRRIDAVKMPSL